MAKRRNGSRLDSVNPDVDWRTYTKPLAEEVIYENKDVWGSSKGDDVDPDFERTEVLR